MKNGYTRSWRDQVREDQCDYPLGVDRDDPAYKLNPDVYERELERLNRMERRERMRHRSESDWW